MRRNKEELREGGENISSHIPPNSPCNLKNKRGKATMNKVTFSGVFTFLFTFQILK